MTGTALHTNEFFQYLILDKIVIAFTAKKIPYSVCVISSWISVINTRICNVLLNFFVSVYNKTMIKLLRTLFIGTKQIICLFNLPDRP